MTREEKSIAIENLTAQLAGTNIIYVSDISGLDAESTSNLRRACFKAGIKLVKLILISGKNYITNAAVVMNQSEKH